MIISTLWTIISIITVIVVFSKINLKAYKWWELLGIGILVYIFAPVVILIYVLLSLAKR